MGSRYSRRSLLQAAAASGALWNLGLPAVAAEETELQAKMVRLQPDIEPLVKLLEQTPRERLVEAVAAEIRQGKKYRDILAALLLAGVRNIQPRPSVGFKFHAVLVVQSVHLAAQAAADSDRWLPIFWALDYFKEAQDQDAREGDWTMGPVRDSNIPAKLHEAFRQAMDSWDEPAADAAVAGLARSAKPEDVFETMFNYGARDFRSIGHKAIFVANAHRVLGLIGWQHAEPVLRSLAYALLQHEGDNPAKRDAAADLSGRRNRKAAGELHANWQEGKADPAATSQLLSVLRAGSEEDSSQAVVEMLNRGVSPDSVWDGLFAGAMELLLRQPGIVALHAVTTTNALHYAWRHCRVDLTRRFVLLQNAAFLPLFREAMGGRGKVADRRIDQLEPAECDRVDEILVETSRQPQVAVGRALGFLTGGGKAQELIQAAQRVLLAKGNDAHDYKFAQAVFEDFGSIGSPWRDRCLAASLLRMHGSQDRDNPLVERVRAAFCVKRLREAFSGVRCPPSAGRPYPRFGFVLPAYFREA